jgi:antitoxin VapB
MAFSIKSPDADRLARRLARLSGESLTAAVIVALRERLERLESRTLGRSLADELDVIARRCAALPVVDGRSADQIIGYDEHGVPR